MPPTAMPSHQYPSPSAAAAALCRGAIGLLLLWAALGTGCHGRKAAAGGAGPAQGVSREVSNGPLTVRVSLDRQEITLADQLQFAIAAECAEDYEVVLPRFGAGLDEFLIREARTDEPRLVGPGRMATGRVYTLEPLVSGTYTLKPMKVTFGKRGEEKPDAHSLETPELTVTVKSLLPEDLARLDVEDIIGPQDLPRPRLRALWYGLAATAALACLGWFALARRRRTRTAPPPRPAHEIAYEELRALVAQDLPGHGRLKEFYQGVSGILRRYIENRFQLHAPERTTEEFLSELSQDTTLAPPHKELLRRFLTHCDLVKFAALVPDLQQVQETFDRCKAFIEETRADRVPAAGGGPP